jgi:UDP-4-amino-4,6-dideoxy-L-N-acetyl-beta-L-altrosamine transaminase
MPEEQKGNALLPNISYRGEEKMIALRPSNYPLTLPTMLQDNGISRLENALADYLGYKHVIALDSIDAAFAVVFSILDKKSGVLCSPNAPVGLFSALRKHELLAQYCDLKLDGTLEARFMQKSRTESTAALLVSHNHGQLAETEKLGRFAKDNGLLVIEDAAQAFGKRVSEGSSMAIFDLQALVPAFVARGGFVATDDEQLCAELRQRSTGGYVQKKFWNYDIDNTDDSCTMDGLTAALAMNTLSEIDTMQARIREIQTFYGQNLASNRLIELPKGTDLAAHPLFPVALIPTLFCPKEEIYQALIENGIPVQVGNKPIYLTTAFRDDTLSLFGAEEVYKAQILLPSHHLMTLEDAAFIVKTFESILETYRHRGCFF